MRTIPIKLYWPTDARTVRAVVVAALLALLLTAGGHAASAAPGKDLREKEPLAQAHVNLGTAADGNTAAMPADGKTAAMPAGGKTAAMPAQPEPAWRTGIIDSGQAPFPGALYRFENQWHDVVQGQHVNVYAGVLAQHPKEGVLVVQTTDLQQGARGGRPEVVRPPGRAAALRLMSAHGASLHVASADGRRFTFEVASRELRPE